MQPSSGNMRKGDPSANVPVSTPAGGRLTATEFPSASRPLTGTPLMWMTGQLSKLGSSHQGKKSGMSSDTFIVNSAGRFSRNEVTPSAASGSLPRVEMA